MQHGKNYQLQKFVKVLEF